MCVLGDRGRNEFRLVGVMKSYFELLDELAEAIHKAKVSLVGCRG